MKGKGKAFVIGATGLAVAGLVGLPQVGTQAKGSQTDEVNISVTPGCTLVSRPDDATMRAVTVGQGGVAKEIEGVTFDLVCNEPLVDGTWAVTAQGKSGAKLSDGAGHEIASTGGELTGETSNWAMKMVVTGSAKVEGGYLDYSKVPDTATRVASNIGEEMKEGATIKAHYGVSAEASQVAGSYTGEVEYTITNTASH